MAYQRHGNDIFNKDKETNSILIEDHPYSVRAPWYGKSTINTSKRECRSPRRQDIQYLMSSMLDQRRGVLK